MMRGNEKEVLFSMKMPVEVKAWLEEEAASNCRSMAKQVLSILLERMRKQAQVAGEQTAGSTFQG